eukprot:scaffold7821_cov277-Pinguiococcus_pyrenoidosus.AAC.1
MQGRFMESCAPRAFRLRLHCRQDIPRVLHRRIRGEPVASRGAPHLSLLEAIRGLRAILRTGRPVWLSRIRRSLRPLCRTLPRSTVVQLRGPFLTAALRGTVRGCDARPHGLCSRAFLSWRRRDPLRRGVGDVVLVAFQFLGDADVVDDAAVPTAVQIV